MANAHPAGVTIDWYLADSCALLGRSHHPRAPMPYVTTVLSVYASKLTARHGSLNRFIAMVWEAIVTGGNSVSVAVRCMCRMFTACDGSS